MLVLAIDTCDSRGSVAVLRDEAVLALLEHEPGVDYSLWLLSAVASILSSARLRMTDVEGYAVGSGPGSFTGVRVGLTTVKGWAEVYGKPIVAVSRLEAIAGLVRDGAKYVAVFADAQRGQVFGAVYRREGDALSRIGEEMVIAPDEFVQEASQLAREEKISWVSTGPAIVLAQAGWKEREKRGEHIQEVSAFLAGVIGRIGAQRLHEGKSTDALGLDANYVRRSDAEIFWKGGSAAHGR